MPVTKNLLSEEMLPISDAPERRVQALPVWGQSLGSGQPASGHDIRAAVITGISHQILGVFAADAIGL